MSESPPRWIEPEQDGEARLALDLIPPASGEGRLWFFIPGLSSHRRGEKALYFAREIARRGEAFASLDLTGHGDSQGDLLRLSLSRNLGDLERGLRFAEAEAGPFSSILLIGSSMGGLTALWYAARQPDRIAANLVMAPAFEMAGRVLLSLGQERARQWREEGKIHLKTDYAEFELGYGFVEDEARYPTSNLVKQLATPTLILHGTEDETVPCQLSLSFAHSLATVKLVLTEGGDHRLTAHKETLFDEMWAFANALGAQEI